MDGREIREGVEIELVWAIEADFASDGEARRRPVRHAHLANLSRPMREGVGGCSNYGGFSNEGAVAYATTSGRRLRLLSRVGRPTPTSLSAASFERSWGGYDRDRACSVAR
jgi:hypothetical protein